MTPRLEACYFGGDRWRRLARVLEYSARKWCPSWDVHVAAIEPGTTPSPLGIPAHANNLRKLEWWADEVAAARDGDSLLLVDVDVVVLRPLHDVWEMDFDLAYTTKEAGARFPFNCGVVFVRVGERTRRFMEAWRAENRRLFQDGPALDHWKGCFGGLNQSALGSLFSRASWRAVYRDIVEIDLAGLRLKTARLPCLEWNCENANWVEGARDPSRIRILHVKDELRACVFRDGGPPMWRLRRGIADPLAHLKPLIELWHQYEREAGGQEVQQT